MTDFLCHVKEGLDDEKRQDWRAACEDLDFYREHESKRYCVLHYPGQEKEADEQFHSEVRKRLNGNVIYLPGVFFPSNIEVRDRQFTLPVDFSGATFAEKARFYKVRFQHNASFTDTTFHGGASFEVTNFEKVADFSEASFIKGPVNFSQTTFKLSANFRGISFGDTDFDRVTFEKQGNFYNSTFRGEVAFRGGCAFKEARFSKTVFEGQAYFTDTAFAKVTFFGATFGDTVSFLESTFGTAKFSYVAFRNFALFNRATFEEKVDFTNAHFKTALFEEATFHRSVDFTYATFSPLPTRRTDLRRATFKGELYCRETEFSGYTDFYRAEFLDAVKFIGREDVKNGEPKENGEPKVVLALDGRVSFTRARIDRPELFSFDTVWLRPRWFINTDGIRAINFFNALWCGIDRDTAGNVSDEIETLRRWGTPSPHYQISRTCRELAINAEENHRYDEASTFRYWAMDAQRTDPDVSAHAPLRPIWWYWLLSGYGEKPRRSALWLAGILTFFALLYLGIGLAFDVGPARVAGRLSIESCLTAIWQALVYSLGVMTLQNASLELETSVLLRTIVWVQGIVGPLQIALLALALRRRFMRSS